MHDAFVYRYRKKVWECSVSTSKYELFRYCTYILYNDDILHCEEICNWFMRDKTQDALAPLLLFMKHCLDNVYQFNSRLMRF